MSWWCAAQGTPWTWSWQPYPGVWAFVALLLAVRVTAERMWSPGRSGKATAGSIRHLALYVCGVVVLWIATDWPVGALGAGYLVSVHTLQFILFALVAPPLLIAGTPPWMWHRVLRPPLVRAVAGGLARPLTAFAVFNVVMLGTHLPNVVDTLMTTQLGAFGVEMLWLLAGLVFWIPVIGPAPELNPVPIPGRIVYLIANIFLPTVPAAFLTFASYPLYSLYELAPPIQGIPKLVDQQVAGILMKLGGAAIILGAGSVLFFRWSGREIIEEMANPAGGDPADDDRGGESQGEPVMTG